MTPARFTRIKQTLAQRQPDLTVLLDDVHKPHNIAAITRSCEAVGVLEAHAVWPNPRMRPPHGTSGGSARWLPVHVHSNLLAARDVLKSRGFSLVAAHLSEATVDFRALDYTRPTAFVLGAELKGLSAEGLDMADAHVEIPMHGLTRSLNVSVAAATLLYEAERQRSLAGCYAQRQLGDEDYQRLLFEWSYPELARRCRLHELGYPELGPDGELPDASMWRPPGGADIHAAAAAGGPET